MVYLQPARNRPVNSLVDESMGASRCKLMSPWPEPTVAVFVTLGCPKPAAIGLDFNLRPETGRQAGVAKSGKLVEHRKHPFRCRGAGRVSVAAPIYARYNHYTTLLALTVQAGARVRVI